MPYPRRRAHNLALVLRVVHNRAHAQAHHRQRRRLLRRLVVRLREGVDVLGVGDRSLEFAPGNLTKGQLELDGLAFESYAPP